MAHDKTEQGEKVVATNRKAFHDYAIQEKVEAGIALVGTEVKALREGRANLRDSFASVDRGQVVLHHCHISPYSHGNIMNHEPLRPRVLLLHRKEQDARAQGLVVHDVAVAVRADVAVMEHHLSAVHAGEAVPEVGPPLTQGLHLSAHEGDPGLHLLLDRVIVERLAVGRDDLLALLCLVVGHALRSSHYTIDPHSLTV